MIGGETRSTVHDIGCKEKSPLAFTVYFMDGKIQTAVEFIRGARVDASGDLSGEGGIIVSRPMTTEKNVESTEQRYSSMHDGFYNKYSVPTLFFACRDLTIFLPVYSDDTTWKFGSIETLTSMIS